MPRVLRIINRFNLGGPTFNAALLTRYMQPEYDTMLIGGKEQDSEESSKHILDELGIKGHLITEMQRDIGLSNDRLAYKEVKKIIRKYKPDIIHTHASKAGAIGRSAGIAYGKAKMVHTFHGHVFHSYFGSVKTNLYKNIERALALKTDKIIAISSRQKVELSKKYNICSANKIAVIPLGFDLDKFRENRDEKRKDFRKTYGLKDDEIAIGIIGRLVPIKNHKLFIKAFQIVKNRTNKKVRAFIVGDGSESEDLKKYAKSLGLNFTTAESPLNETASVHFTSWIKNVDWVNAGLDIIALSSLNEGTPVSLIEAQASGKPVVSTQVGGVANIMLPNRTGLLTEDQSEECFAKNLEKLVLDSDMAVEMGKKGEEFVSKKFHYNRLVRDMKLLYEELLEK